MFMMKRQNRMTKREEEEEAAVALHVDVIIFLLSKLSLHNTTNRFFKKQIHLNTEK